jgi:hypothetical protein
MSWQDIVVATIVLAAAAYLARQMRRALARKRAAGCGSCASCPTGTTDNAPQIVELKSSEPPVPSPFRG